MDNLKLEIIKFVDTIADNELYKKYFDSNKIPIIIVLGLIFLYSVSKILSLISNLPIILLLIGGYYYYIST